MNKDILDMFRRLSPDDKALASRVVAALAPSASCGVVELAELSFALLNRLGLNTAEKIITAIASK